MRLAAALDVSPLSLILPPDDDEQVVIVPQQARPWKAEHVRWWIEGSWPITAVLQADDRDADLEYRTLDGRVLTTAEGKERQRFYETEVSSRQWRISQTPGLSHLRAQVGHYIRETLDGGHVEIRRSHLDQIAAEVERQRAALDTEARN